MSGRTLVWTGRAFTGQFGAAANYENAAGNPVKTGPLKGDTVDLTSYGTITGNGNVAALNVTGEFFLGTGSIFAATLNVTDDLSLLSGERLHTASLTDGGTVTVLAGGALAASGTALNGFVSASSQAPAVLEVDGKLNIGAGTLTIGDYSGNLGILQGGGGTLVGAAGSVLNIGANDGNAIVDVTNEVLNLQGSVTVGLNNQIGEYESVTLLGGPLSAQQLDIGNADAASVKTNGTTIEVGSQNGTGLSIGSGILALSGGALSSSGAIEVGFGGLMQIDQSAALMTAGGATIDGTLSLAGGSTWTDIGDVEVDGRIALSGLAQSATINGNLQIGSQYPFDVAQLALTNSVLDVHGNITAYSATIGGISSTLSSSAITLAGSSINVGFITTLLVTDESTFVQISTGMSDTVRTDQGQQAAALAGTIQVGGTLSLTGYTTLSGTLDLQGGGVLTAVSRKTALQVAQGGTVSVQSSTLTAQGGLSFTSGTVLTATGGAITLSASSGDALLLSSGSTAALNGTSVSLSGASEIDGTLTLTGASVQNSGTLTTSVLSKIAGTGTLTGSVVSNCFISAGLNGAGTLTLTGALGGSGDIALNGSNLNLLGSVGAQDVLQYEQAGGTITLGDAGAFAGTIADWSAGDTLSLLNVTAANDAVNGNTLVLTNSNLQVVASIHFGSTVTASEFVLHADGHGNTVVTFA